VEVYHKLHTGQARDPDDPAPVSTEDWDDPHRVVPHSVTADDLEAGLLDGITGPRGPVGMVWRGPWAVGTAYSASDVVAHDGTSYICTQQHTGQVPPNGTFWDSLAERGATWWHGSGVPTLVVGAAPGDYYLDDDSGIVYQLG
jgi:hypothetical protein